MRGYGGGNYEEFIEGKLITCIFGYDEVADVNGIESTTKRAYLNMSLG